MTNHVQSKENLDCINLKNKVQEEIYMKTRNMSLDEEVHFYNQQAEQGPLSDWWGKIKPNSNRAVESSNV